GGQAPDRRPGRRIRSDRHARARRTSGRLAAGGPHAQWFSGRAMGPGMTEPTTVLIADDQRVVREGLTMVLGLMPGVEIVGSARDGEEAITLVGQLQPDVVLMDLRMPRCDGVEATRRLTQSGTTTKVVVLTTYAD